MASSENSSFFIRHEFLLRRLHSLSGLIPVGAYMVVHLATNASVLAGADVFQGNVDKIHMLGPLLPFVEWVFIFIPILFHAIFGIVIIASGQTNVRDYRYISNLRYSLQRATGMVAFVFIGFHLWQLHHLGEPLGGGKFDPTHATSSAASAIATDWLIIIAYAIGLLSCVFHLANGLWTMGITWGVWTSPGGQLRARRICDSFGVLLAVVGLSAVGGLWEHSSEDALKRDRGVENRMKIAREFNSGQIVNPIGDDDAGESGSGEDSEGEDSNGENSERENN